jgi:glycosyltransferase involved in cell wall biosynthesis
MIDGSNDTVGSKRRLLVLTSTFPRWNGDTEPRFVFDLCRRLTGEFDIDVIAPGHALAKAHETLDSLNVHRFRYAPAAFQNLCYEGGITARLRRRRWRYALVPPFLIAGIMATSKLLRRHRYDVVHAHWLIPQGIQALAALRMSDQDVPLVVTSHGADLFGLQSPPFPRFKRMVVERATTVTVVSEVMRRRVRRLVPESESIVASMGIDARSLFTPGTKPRSSTELLYVGRLAEKKGVATLLHAFSILWAQHPELTLSIVGSGPDERALQSLCLDLDLGKRVRFLGRLSHDEIAPLYRNCLATIVPSVVADDGDQEGLGLTAVEAMACGAPVIASDLEALREVIVHERTGLLVKSGDQNALAAAIMRLAADPEMADRLGSAARDEALHRFDWDNVAARYKTLLLEAADRQMTR